MTLDEFDLMVLKQEGRCAICAEPAPNLSVDHCHTHGHVRSLLCPKCNLGLGAFDDDPERLRAAARYVVKHRPKT